MKNRVVWRTWSMIGVLSMAMGLSGCQNTLQSGKGGTLSVELLADSAIERAAAITSAEKWIEALNVKNDEIQLKVDDTSQIEVELKGNDSAVYRLQYDSSDEAVCTVTAGGVLKGLEPGEAVITIEDLFSGLRAEVKIIVSDSIQPEQIQFGKEELSLAVGEVSELQVTVSPEDADKELLIWQSSDSTIATVNEKGEIAGVANGECKIIAVLQGYEDICAEIKVIVTNGNTTDNNGSNAESGNAGNGSSNSGSSNETASGGNSNGAGGSDNTNSGNAGTNDSGSNSGGNESNANGNSSADNGNSGGGTNNGGLDSNSGAATTTEATTEAPASGYYVDAYAEQVLAIVNARRSEAGLAPLTMNYSLVSAAKVRATETVQLFSHTRPNGTSCFTAIDEAGVGYMGAGENIAAGQASPDSVMNAWMNSEGHRANIMDGSFTQIGIACYYDPNSPYGYYWVQCFIY